MLLDKIQDSKILIGEIAYQKQYAPVIKSMPAIDEAFNNFIHFLREQDVDDLEEVCEWNDDLVKIQDGVYKKNKKLISVRTVPQGLFPYMAYYALGRNQKSKHIKDLSGKYINILTLCEDGVHYEPEAFSFLVLDNFFKSHNPKNIFPCLLLPSVIPEPLEFQWVFIAMRYMNMELSKQIDYHYLADNEKEIELLKEFDLY